MARKHRLLFDHLPCVLAVVLLGFLFSVNGQTCGNYGQTSPTNSSSCLCPPGFGGATCAQPGCGGTIFDGSSRSLAQPTSSSGFANLTASGCTCETGWGGVGCNVCTTSSACQLAYTAVHGNASATLGLGSLSGLNDTMVCNTAPTVWAAGQLSCQVNNPTLEAIYPLQSTLNIFRTLNSTLSPLHNTTGTVLSPSGNSSIYAQFFYDGVEQFYCSATPCTQTISNTTTSSGSTTLDTWTCQDLSCTCIQNATFCGGVPVSNLTGTINSLSGTLVVACDSTNTCHFQQNVLATVFGSQGLAMEGCVFGECVTQAVIDTTNATSSTAAASGGTQLGGGVIAGLAVVGSLIALGLTVVAWGWFIQRAARRLPFDGGQGGGINVQWSGISYVVQLPQSSLSSLISKPTVNGGKTILDGISGSIEAGQIMAILGPSGAGKTTLIELISGKAKSGKYTGSITFPPYPPGRRPRIAFVPQNDILPPMLTVREALTFAASLRLPESIPESSKAALVSTIISKLGLAGVAEARIGATDGTGRGISGGEARRVSIGLELVGCPDVLVCDEPTSGLDSVSAWRVVNVLKEVARGGGVAIGHQGSQGERKGVAVICSVHQPSSRLYHAFDTVLLLSEGRALYSGPGGLTPARHFMRMREGGGTQADIPPYEEGYNVADYLLEISSESPDIFKMMPSINTLDEKTSGGPVDPNLPVGEKDNERKDVEALSGHNLESGVYAVTFLTQLQVLCGREWKILKRDKTLFFTHLGIACVLGIFCGGLYYQTGITIAGFQARVGCLFFLGSLVAFSSLSALYNIVEIRPLFLRERSNWYYSPTAWLLSRLIFDVIPLRIIPSIAVSTITYWMAGLSSNAAHFFKFLFIIALYTLVMTLFNFLLGTLFRNGGIAILLSALSGLYQMTFAGFFVHLNSIPPIIRWLQWLCPLKYALEAITVNEVGSGLMIKDTLQGVPVSVSATLIMQLLFGFGLNNYYRDVLALFAFIAGIGIAVIAVVWLKVRERR